MADAYAEIEAKMNAIKDAREIERAIDLCKRGVANGGMVYKIAAEDASEAERSIDVKFTLEESAAIFEATIVALTPRLNVLREKLGIEQGA